VPEKLIAVFPSRRATISDVTLRLAREHQARARASRISAL
jgi:hypothetical protein